MALNARFIEGMQHLFVGARVDEVRLGGPLWSPAVGYQQGSLGASEAPERGAGCPRHISFPPPKAGREKEGPE